jgi:hypothetical protein
MKPTVYIETTILSYLVSRPSRDLIVAGRQEITREWWEFSALSFDLVLSQVVLDEISAGDPEHAKNRMRHASMIPALEITQSAVDLAQAIQHRGLIPPGEVRDALHISVATVWRNDYLLTWNCKHIANAQIIRQLEKYVKTYGYDLPVICTPESLQSV